MPSKPWTVAILALLDDREWHAREDMIVTGMRAVPPGVAFRKGEQIRAHLAGVKGYQFGPRTRGNDATSIATGARERARKSIAMLTARGRVERALIDGVDSFRLAQRTQAKAS